MADPHPICYLNGAFGELRDARISPLDRGFLFADSIYEVLPVFSGRPFRFREHFDRLARSLAEVEMINPHTHEQWLELLQELIHRNGGGDMYVYVQVTRGMEFGRNHAFPASAKPSVFAMAAPLPALSAALLESGLSAITVEDFRWGRCDIKTTALLANVLMKQRAAAAGAHEAIIVREGKVLEGASSSVLIVSDGAIVTPPNSRSILPGTTRDVALELAEALAPLQIRDIGIAEFRAASEIWIAAATRDAAPITKVDDRPVGAGRPGPMWLRMSRLIAELKQRLAHSPAF
jgi:D-alanine transaminase